MHRHRTNRDGNAAEGSVQAVFGARFKLAVNSSASQRVGYANSMYSLPSVSQVRGLTRPRGLKPRGGQIALPYELEGLWLEVYREGGIAVHVVDEPANGYTRGCGDSSTRIQADDGMKFEFTPTGSDRLLVVATHNGDLISLPVKVLLNMGNIVQRAWEKDAARLMKWRGGICRVDEWR